MGGRHLIDIAGQRFGMLTAVRPTERRLHRTIVWECKCDCGNTAFVSLGHLKQGSTKSCGCLRQQKKKAAEEQSKILEGMRFGRLTVVRSAEEQEPNADVWECKCGCGNTVFVKGVELQKGRVESCGCLTRELAAKRCLDRNRDMVGKRFGRLTTIRPTGEIKSDSMVWECKCDCGNTAFVIQRSLKSGGTKSCGCLRRKESYKSAVDLSLTGQRFGKLVALSPTDETKNSSAVWECRCDCGNAVRFSQIQLLRMKNPSCGCDKEPKAAQKGKTIEGKRFGRLTAIQPTGERIRGSIVWECRCDCGNTAKYSRVQLRTMKNLSCGCEKVQNPSQKGKSIEGQRFGRLIAIRPTEERKNKSVVWECLCDCGNTVLENQVALTRGRTLSCGCLQKEQEEERLNALTKENAGKRFGRLTILHAVTEADSKRVQYVCRCDCGNEKLARLPALERGLVQSCGCLNKDLGKQMIHDLTGQQFGYLTVIRKTDERRNRAVVWECKCVCGKTTYVAANTLKCGNTKSCGCKGKGKTQETIV